MMAGVRDRERDIMTSGRQTSSIEQFEAICRARGGRMTRQRRAVLAKLLEASRPVSAYELRDMVRPDNAAITPASVYRCLEFLVELGLVHRLETTRSFIACDHPDHRHSVQFLICRLCGSVVEAEDTRMADAAESLGHRLGFALDQPTVELTGVCASCKTSAASSGAGPGKAGNYAAAHE